MREIARIVSFNGVKIDTMCDFSVLTSLPGRLSGKNGGGGIPYFEGGGRFPMPGVKVPRGVGGGGDYRRKHSRWLFPKKGKCQW